MIDPTDIEYIATKKIIQGKATMQAEFKPLADWIDSTYGVKTVNIIYDIIEHSQNPRLQICFEFEKELLNFKGKYNFGFNDERQQEVARKFENLLSQQTLGKNRFLDFLNLQPNSKYSSKNILIVFNAFEPIAMVEANESIPENKIIELKNSIKNEALWEISRCFSAVTFFTYTDIQAKEFANSDTRKFWTNKYFDLLKNFDEFNYFNRENFGIHIDSKENFDKNFQGNWYYYYK